jgi:hypothetical protein
MMTLAEPPDRWDADTTTAEALEALRPAVDPIVGSMVIAEAPAMKPWIGFKDGCVLPKFQGAFQPGRVRSLNWRA